MSADIEQTHYQSILAAGLGDHESIFVVRIGLGEKPDDWPLDGPDVALWVDAAHTFDLPMALPDGRIITQLHKQGPQQLRLGTGFTFAPYRPSDAMLACAERHEWDVLNSFELSSVRAHYVRLHCDQNHLSKNSGVKALIRRCEDQIERCTQEIESRHSTCDLSDDRFAHEPVASPDLIDARPRQRQA